MNISLVIPIRNETASLPALLESIRGQTRQPEEVILVDGGSVDGTAALARQLAGGDARYRVIEAGPATPGRGRNVGIAAAEHEWIALTDAGIRLEPDWLAELAAVAERQPEVEIVYGNYEPTITTRFAAFAALTYVPPRVERPGGRMRGPSTASMMLRHSTWETVGGFPDLRAAEDLIFMERVQSAGCRIGWAPRATAWWQLQPTLGGTFRRFVLYSRHNVWAGRQAQWHHGVARQYLAAALVLLLAILWSPWWLVALPAGLAVRVGKSLWQRREQHGPAWLLNPLRWAAVGAILLLLDLATLIGWLQAIWQKPPTSTPTPQVKAVVR